MNCDKCTEEIRGVGFHVKEKRICLKCYLADERESFKKKVLKILKKNIVKKAMVEEVRKLK